jgi:hypothetical protein
MNSSRMPDAALRCGQYHRGGPGEQCSSVIAKRFPAELGRGLVCPPKGSPERKLLGVCLPISGFRQERFRGCGGQGPRMGLTRR